MAECATSMVIRLPLEEEKEDYEEEPLPPRPGLTWLVYRLAVAARVTWTGTFVAAVAGECTLLDVDEVQITFVLLSSLVLALGMDVVAILVLDTTNTRRIDRDAEAATNG